jgi:hypothetical protein
MLAMSHIFSLMGCSHSDLCFLLCDLHESLLDELYRSRHGVRVNLDVWKQVLVSPTVGLCGRTAKFDLHTALLQIGNEPLVGIARRDVAVCIATYQDYGLIVMGPTI